MKKKNRRNNAPFTAPESADSDATPAIILRGMLGIFTDPEAPDPERSAALDLDLAFTLDPSAERDLLDAIGCQGLSMSTAAGFDCMMGLLEKVGAVERKNEPSHTEMFWLRFDARPLLDLLKAMPHRDPSLGIRRELMDDCTETNNENKKD